jgi:capsular exopolysaccharide synthesis family protein
MASIVYADTEEAPFVSHDDYGYDPQGPAVKIGPLLRQALSLARRNLWLILAIVATFLVGAVIMTMLMTPKYTASTSIEISTRSDQVLGDKLDSNQPEDVDVYDMDRFLNSQLEILNSRALAQRVAQRLNLFSNPRFFVAMQADEDKYDNQTERRNGVIRLLQDHFSSELPTQTRIAQISITSTDAKMSADIANAYAAEFIQWNLQRRFDSSSYARNFVQSQLEVARTRLEKSEQELNAYARQAGLIRTRDPSNTDGSSTASNSITTSSLMQLNQAANDAQTRRVVAETHWNAEKAQPLLSSPAALASLPVQELLNRRSELQAQLDSAKDRYLESHPTVQRLSSQLSTTEAQLTRAATQARDAVRADYVAARAAEARLRAQVDQLESATLHEQDRSVRYNTLAREADTNRSVYDGLLQRYRELNASAGITASNVSVIDQAEPPEKPSSPRPLINLAAALLLGFVIAAAVVFLKDQLDDRVRVPEEVEQKVGLNLLGVVPEAKGEDPIEALRDPKSVVSESYSALRSSLLYSTRDGLPGLMLVTSAQASEGKSTTSFATARSMSLVGKRTLLIDADLRRPSVHRIAGIPNKIGLSNVLIGDKTAEEAIVPGEVPDFFIMPSGPVPPSPAELLSSPRLTRLFETLRQNYDCVIVDSAPVLGLADSPGLSAMVDGVLLVIEANRGRGGQLKAAIRRLRLMKPTILGAVLTKFDPHGAGNSYSTYYNYDYYQYRSDDTARS